MQTIILGAGILGASTAFHLAKSGVNVTVVDRDEKGQATDAAAGIICPWISQRRNKKWYEIVKGGARYYPQMIKELEETGEMETGYSRVGAISIHTDHKKLEQIEERACKRREGAPEIGDVIRLSAIETKALFPPLSDDYESVFISGAARVNGRALRQALINAAKKHGATFIHGNAKLIVENTQVKGIAVSDTNLYADQVIVTAGAWANELFRPLGINFKVSSQKAQILHLEIPGMDTEKWPVVMPPTDQYLLTFGQGHVVVGATHENNAGFDPRVTAGGIHEVLDKALSIAPGLADATLLETRVGFRPFTPGFLPVIGGLPSFEGVLVANGLGASGLTSGPYLGMELAKHALGTRTELDLSNYPVAEAIEFL